MIISFHFSKFQIVQPNEKENSKKLNVFFKVQKQRGTMELQKISFISSLVQKGLFRSSVLYIKTVTNLYVFISIFSNIFVFFHRPTVRQAFFRTADEKWDFFLGGRWRTADAHPQSPPQIPHASRTCGSLQLPADLSAEGGFPLF